MNKEVLNELHKNNLCTYFILPLLKLNKFSFSSEENFVNSYLSTNCRYILVKVREIKSFGHRLELNPYFIGVYTDELNEIFIKHLIPVEFETDVDLFKKGKFSMLSQTAKVLICRYSGLIYQFLNTDGVQVTDIRLLALDRAVQVKTMWEDYLNVCLDNDDELLETPPERSYMECDKLVHMKI